MTFTLTTLGTASPYPRPDQACSGYLLRTATTTVWVDAGPGTLANLQRHTRPDRLDAIWISHTHADHTADLLTAYYALLFADLHLDHPIPLYAPPGLAERLETFLAGAGPNPASAAFTVHDLHDDHRTEIGDLTLHTLAVDHGLPAYGLRATHAGATLAYSGDTAPCAALDRLADGAHLFLCEADTTTPSPLPLHPGRRGQRGPSSPEPPAHPPRPHPHRSRSHRPRPRPGHPPERDPPDPVKMRAAPTPATLIG